MTGVQTCALPISTWEKDTQRAVVWTRLCKHCKLANCSLAKINKRFLTLHQEQQLTQAKSSHELLSCDIVSIIHLTRSAVYKATPISLTSSMEACYVTVGTFTRHGLSCLPRHWEVGSLGSEVQGQSPKRTLTVADEKWLTA